MKNQIILAGLLLCLCAHTLPASPSAGSQALASETPRTIRSLSSGWKFHPEEVPGAELSAFDDRAWRTVSVPHDWSIEGAYSRSNATPSEDFTQWVVWKKEGAQAYLPRGIGWYRLDMDLPAMSPGKKVILYVEGAYRESDVWLNGTWLGHHASGYTSFSYDITDTLRPGGNVLAVRCDARLKEGWWYEACGIYRPVYLQVTDKLSVSPWGVWVSTPEIIAGKATARIQTTVRNDHAGLRMATVRTRILDALGAVAGSVETTTAVGPGKECEVVQEIGVPSPRLWSPDEPYLYQVNTEVGDGTKVTDATETPFGIRTFHFDPELGFFLNGKPVKLWGAANHMDIASLGGALPPRVCFENTRVLKASGANFLRGAHNPRTPAELDAADRLGVCVVDETRYFDNSAFGLTSLREMILRDRNHPSVIIWGLGNEEEGRQGTPAGVAIAKDLIKVVRETDPYRATSIAQNRDWSTPCGFSDLFDVLGENWRDQQDSLNDHRLFPKRAVYISEYNYGGNWDLYASWPWMAGAACWGGFEYYGEASWPDKSWPGQIADLCHEPGANYHRARAQWGKRPMVWVENNWQGQPGKTVTLNGFTNCEQVDVFINGQRAKSVRQNVSIASKDQNWRRRKLDDGSCLLLDADGQALRAPDLKWVTADPASPDQRWNFVNRPGETIAILAGQGGVLNVFGESRDDGGMIQLYGSAGNAPNERWKVERLDGGAFRLIAYQSGKYLTRAAPAGGLMQCALASAGEAPSYVSTGAATLKVDVPFVADSTVRLDGMIGGKVVVTHEIKALGAPERLLLESATATLLNDGMDVALLRCGIADAHGNIIRNVDRRVKLSVKGAGTFAGSGNACRDVMKAGGMTSPETATFNGLCQFAVRAGLTPGVMVASVEADGLESAEATIQVTPESDPQAVEVKTEGERLPPPGTDKGFVVREGALSKTRIAAGEPVEARLVVANVSSAYPVEVAVRVDGKPVSSERFSVPLSGERRITVALPGVCAEGDHTVVVSSQRNNMEVWSRTFTLTVEPTPVTFTAEQLTVTPYVTRTGEVRVTATVRNMGSRKAAARPIPVLLNGRQVAAPVVSLLPGETGEIHAAFAAPPGDRHEIQVGGMKAPVTILKPFKPGAGLDLVGTPAKVAGKNTTALKFSGRNEFMKIHPVDLKEKSFTLWMRCKLDALDGESKESPLFSGGRSADQLGIRGGFHHDKVFFSVWPDNNVASEAKVRPGQWVDLAFVLETKYMPQQTGPDGGDLQAAFWTARNKIYIDGKLQADAASKVYLGDLSQIGAFWGDAKTFNGVIEDVKVFATALSETQVEDLGRGVAMPTQPVLWLKP